MIFIEKPKAFHQILHRLLHELLHQTCHKTWHQTWHKTWHQTCKHVWWKFDNFYFFNFILYFVNDYSSYTKYNVLFINFGHETLRIWNIFDFKSCRSSSLLQPSTWISSIRYQMKNLWPKYETCEKLEFMTTLRDTYSKFSFWHFPSEFHNFSPDFIPLSPDIILSAK